MHNPQQPQQPQQQAQQGSMVSRPSTDLIVIDRVQRGSFSVEVLEHQSLKGSQNMSTARDIYYANQTGVKLRRVRLVIQNSAARLEAGALHYLKGQIDIENPSGGVGGLISKKASSLFTGEAMFRPLYSGTGEIFLEPSFGHFMLHQLQGEQLIVERGAFYACESTVEVGVVRQKNLGAAMLGGEGLFQTSLSGHGVAVLALPVHPSELVKMTLQNETLRVDGSFAFMRRGEIEFTVERSAKGLMGSLTSGEGLLQTFRGTGEVWLAPTQSTYSAMLPFGGAAPFGAQHSSDSSPSGGLIGGILKNIFS